MTNNTGLAYLDCIKNRLTATGLNTLFGTLPVTNAIRKIICIGGNPGADGCDRTIATDKGWRVE